MAANVLNQQPLAHHRDTSCQHQQKTTPAPAQTPVLILQQQKFTRTVLIQWYGVFFQVSQSNALRTIPNVYHFVPVKKILSHLNDP